MYESIPNAAQENVQIPVVQAMLLPNSCAIMSSRRTGNTIRAHTHTGGKWSEGKRAVSPGKRRLAYKAILHNC